MKAANPRSITKAERPWLESWSPETHRILFRALKERYSPEVARNVCSYLATRAIDEDPALSSRSKSTYRKILGQLAADGVTPPSRPKSKHRLVLVTPDSYDGARSSRESGGGSDRSTPVSVGAGGGSNRSTPAPAVTVGSDVAVLDVRPLAPASSITDVERRFLDDVRTVEELGALAEWIADEGRCQYDVALEIVGWLSLKSLELADGRKRDFASQYDRKNYRRILARVSGDIPGYLKAADQAA